MSDYRNPDPRDPVRKTDLRVQEMRDANAMWGWIAGAVMIAIVLGIMFMFGREDTRMAVNTDPPAGANAPANRPAGPPATPPAAAPMPGTAR